MSVFLEGSHCARSPANRASHYMLVTRPIHGLAAESASLPIQYRSLGAPLLCVGILLRVMVRFYCPPLAAVDDFHFERTDCGQQFISVHGQELVPLARLLLPESYRPPFLLQKRPRCILEGAVLERDRLLRVIKVGVVY